MPTTGRNGISALDIMAEPRVRAANVGGAGIVALGEDLASILFANRQGRSLLGQTFGGDGDALLSRDRPLTRQILSAARALEAKGEARILMRAPSSPSAKPIMADLVKIARQNGEGAFVLLLTQEPHARASPPADDAAARLDDAGTQDRPAAIFTTAGLAAANALFSVEDADAFVDAARTFLDAPADIAKAEIGGHAVTLARVSPTHAIVRIDGEAPKREATLEASAGPAEPSQAGGFASFSVKRQKLPGSRGVTSMGALVERWHTRRQSGSDEAASQPLEVEPAEEAAPPGALPFVEAAPTQTDIAARDGEAEAAAASPQTPQPRQHSQWGTPVPVGATEEPASETSDVSDFAVPASSDAQARDDEAEEIAAEPVSVEDATLPAAGEPPAAAPFVADFAAAPVRFVWQIDQDGRFRSLSPDFALAVGPAAAAVIGRSFADVARVFDFDADGDIARLLERRDTWSGRSILWPVEGSDRRVPVDLAALPVYARDRSFDGFRGFGIVRMNEAVADPTAIGLALAATTQAADARPQDDEGNGASTAALDESAPAETDDGGEDPSKAEWPLLRRIEADGPPPPFGRRAVPPKIDPQAGDTLKVIRLEERRRPRDGALSQAEEAAFREIGMKLARPDGADQTPAAPPVPPTEVVLEAQDTDTPPGHANTDVHQIEDAAPFVDEVAVAVDDDAHAAPAGVETFEPLFSALPLPILVQMRGTLVYANPAFAALTRYASIEMLNEAGGLDQLFAPSDTGSAAASGEVILRRADGGLAETRVHIQRVTLAGTSMLVMSFPDSSAIGAANPTAADDNTREDEAPEDEAPQNEADQTHAPDGGTSQIEDLRAEVEELRTVLDTATDGIVLLDMDGNIRAMNGSADALFGIEEHGRSGQHLSTLFAHESQRAVVDYLDMLRETGMAGILNDGREVIGRVSQGGFIPLFITIGRLGEDRGWCVVIRDIAHWKRIEEDLVNARRQAEAASLHKSRFLANISHELRTPLNAIIGFADVMASECFGPVGNERYLEYLGDIKRSGHHVLDLVNDLLDLSKIEAGKVDLSFEAVSLNEVVAEVVSLMQPQANRERVIVRSNLPSSVPPVVADRRTIRQIALNLIANAIRFTPAGGQIIASTTYTGEGNVVLRFRDSGIGMTQNEIEIALTPFQQVQSTSRAKGDGTGLGLPLTKAMVEANRANFLIASTPGEGTLVEISFPSQRVLAD